jgi:amidase
MTHAVPTPPPPVADAFVERFVIEPTSQGSLRGTTFAAKDLFDVAGRHTGCGNPDWRATHGPATSNAAAVQKLLDAGATLVGKTRTDELAYSLDGNNVHEGAPRNAAAPSRLTGGSSSGSASAVAAGEVDFAVGTDTAGSVRVPAAWCGLIGLRPTHGRVTAQGVQDLAPSFDTVGWFARSGTLMREVGRVLLDAALTAATTAAATAATRASPKIEFVRDPVVDAREGEAGSSTAGDALVRRGAFSECREIALGIELERAAECLRVMQAHEVWRTHGHWVEAVRPRFGPGVAERFKAASAITAYEVREAARVRSELLAALDTALPVGRILCLPAVPGPASRRDAPPDVLRAQRSRLLPLTALASLSGRPQISLPLRVADDAPIGVSLLGWRHGDEALLQIAAELLP